MNLICQIYTTISYIIDFGFIFFVGNTIVDINFNVKISKFVTNFLIPIPVYPRDADFFFISNYELEEVPKMDALCQLYVVLHLDTAHAVPDLLFWLFFKTF